MAEHDDGFGGNPRAQMYDSVSNSEESRLRAENAALREKLAVAEGKFRDAQTVVAGLSDLLRKEGKREGEPVAWLIRYDAGGGHESRVAHLHNAVADYRQIDPKATSTPLYASPRAFDSFGEPRGCPTPGACSCPGK